jgi:hypothetical protein
MEEDETKKPAKNIDLDNPETRWRAVKALLVISPFMFVGCYLLAWAQGAEPRYGLLIAAVGTGMCLAAAGTIHLMGSKSIYALIALKVALLLVGRR